MLKNICILITLLFSFSLQARTLSRDMSFPSGARKITTSRVIDANGHTITIPEGCTVEVAKGVTLTVKNGTLALKGDLDLQGKDATLCLEEATILSYQQSWKPTRGHIKIAIKGTIEAAEGCEVCFDLVESNLYFTLEPKADCHFECGVTVIVDPELIPEGVEIVYPDEDFPEGVE